MSSNRRSGKDAFMQRLLLEAVHRGETVALMSYKEDGALHVCTVYPFRSKYNDH